MVERVGLQLKQFKIYVHKLTSEFYLLQFKIKLIILTRVLEALFTFSLKIIDCITHIQGMGQLVKLFKNLRIVPAYIILEADHVRYSNCVFVY